MDTLISFEILNDIQSCILKLLEFGLFTREDCRSLVEIQQNFCEVFELDLPSQLFKTQDYSQMPYLRFFKTWMTSIVYLRCRILSQAWLVLLDEYSCEEKKSRKLDTEYQRVISSQVGLFKLIQIVMDKQQRFKIPANIDQAIDYEFVIKEFVLKTDEFSNPYNHIPWNTRNFEDLDHFWSKQSILENLKIEDFVNSHVTSMLKITGIGGSQFLLENLAFGHPLFTKIAHQ